MKILNNHRINGRIHNQKLKLKKAQDRLTSSHIYQNFQKCYCKIQIVLKNNLKVIKKNKGENCYFESLMAKNNTLRNIE